MLNLIDEYTRECLLIRAERRWSSAKVIGALADVMVDEGSAGASSFGQWPGVRGQRPAQMAGEHRSQDTVHRTRLAMGERLLRSFNSKLRDEFLNGEIFYSIKELRVLAERWRVHYNTVRPHSSLGYQTTGTGGMADHNNKGHGEVETATRFPLLHTPDGDGI